MLLNLLFFSPGARPQQLPEQPGSGGRAPPEPRLPLPALPRSISVPARSGRGTALGERAVPPQPPHHAPAGGPEEPHPGRSGRHLHGEARTGPPAPGSGTRLLFGARGENRPGPGAAARQSPRTPRGTPGSPAGELRARPGPSRRRRGCCSRRAAGSTCRPALLREGQRREERDVIQTRTDSG